MQTMIIERNMHVSVFAVSMDTPSNIHVRTGNIRYEVPNPINLTLQALSFNEE